MNKSQFLAEIKKGISSLPNNDCERYLQYYSEMIDDRVEDGVSEEDAVADMGNLSDIIGEILGEASSCSGSKPDRSARKTAWIGVGLLGMLTALMLLCSLLCLFSSVLELILGNVLSALFVIGVGFIFLGIAGFVFLGIYDSISELRQGKGE